MPEEALQRGELEVRQLTAKIGCVDPEAEKTSQTKAEEKTDHCERLVASIRRLRGLHRKGRRKNTDHF